MRNMVDGSSKRDIMEKSAFTKMEFHLPKIYVKVQYCISCAIHSRTVRVRSSKARQGEKGERFKRFTTRLRKHVRPEVMTGSAAIPVLSSKKFDFLQKNADKKE